ncbi:MAG: hypothetical protein M3Z10_11190 [Gemmatimonadota bacterium]|nr:hypothetical protein [Gemmatimonadota bacterium]
MLSTGSPIIDAEAAFDRANRERLRAAVRRALRRGGPGRLRVYDERARTQPRFARRREIPLGQIRGTVEPFRAAMFDCAFRPTPSARRRWQRVWLAEARGAVLPPITVVAVGDGYAVRDGHHRVSVARARGAQTIDAEVEGAVRTL